MRDYIGVKMVKAEPQEKDGKDGYKVVYPDGYTSWSPKDTFEAAYLVVDPDRIHPVDVEAFHKVTEDMRYDQTTTLVTAVCRNGASVTNICTHPDPEHYNHDLGVHVAHALIKQRLRENLEFVLQWGKNGLRPAKPELESGTFTEG